MARARALNAPAAVLHVLLCLPLAACGDVPQPFRHDGPNLALIPAASRGVMVPPPDDGPQGAGLAAALVKHLNDTDIPASVRPVVPGAWILRTEAETGLATVRLRWRLMDGETELGIAEQTLPLDAWTKADPKALDMAAAAAVDKLAAALAGGTASAVAPSAPAAPASRPPIVRLIPPAGLPGDGDKALGAAMRRMLEAAGAKVVDRGEVLFQVKGQASVDPGGPGQESLSVAWSVEDDKGETLGTAAQQGEVPRGRLAGPWGGLADDIAAGGAQGVIEILRAAMR